MVTTVPALINNCMKGWFQKPWILKNEIASGMASYRLSQVQDEWASGLILKQWCFEIWN